MIPWLLDKPGQWGVFAEAFWASLAWVWSIVALVLVVGCAFTHREAVKRYWLDYPAPTSLSAHPVPETLMVYRFLLAPNVDANSVALAGSREAERAVSLHPWARNPADMITDLIERDLASSGLFRRTVGQTSSLPYRYALEGTIHSLRGVRVRGTSKALVDVEVLLLDFGVRVGGEKHIMERRYRIEAPCKDSTPEAMVQGLNDALSEMSLRLRKDIRSSLQKTEGLPGANE
jgi:uncharacterized lipoprotein YmbA